ncbi:MAG: PqqD family protein [Candidatus Brocadia sp.]|nr:PqqD family protein [Candidatus Brocadia sp.]
MMQEIEGAAESVNTTKPIRKPGIMVQDMGRETLLYSAEGKAIHVLNPTAKLIWELCDGKHSIEEMEQVIRAGFSISDNHNVAGDIRHTLEVFTEKGVVEKKGL